jgi:hypothetical protein
MWMRSFLTLGAIAGACLYAGCSLGISAASPTGPGGDDNLNGYDAGPGDGSTDAPIPESGHDLYQGSPLCALTYTSACDPDDTHPDCMTAADDGGSRPPLPDAGAPSPFACRVAIDDGKPTATCDSSSVTNPLGYSSSPCTTGGDCAPGYECVLEEAADGGAGKRCRHYCCNEQECGEVSGSYYCGIQPVADNSGSSVWQNVPVCMPVVTGCQLLSTTGCPLGQTCSVVREGSSTDNYAATCVDTGHAQAGDSCETENCGPGLACLGTPDQRTCWQLCDANHPCGTGSGCTLGQPPYFSADTVSSFGICQPSATP